jgi:hypothetical protein
VSILFQISLVGEFNMEVSVAGETLEDLARAVIMIDILHVLAI